MDNAVSELNQTNRPRARDLREVHGGVLRRRREVAGRSLADVAAAAQCSPAHLSEVERGRKDVSAERLAAIAAALDVPLHVLYTEIAEALTPADAVAALRSTDPRRQLEYAAATLGGEALLAVAHFGSYMASTSAPSRRRIGFAVPSKEDSR